MMRRWLVLAAAAVLGACALKGDVEPPAELQPVEQSLPLQRVWRHALGGDERLQVALRPATDGQTVYAAGGDGQVVALTLDGGRVLWRRDVGQALSGGPGAADGLVVVGGRDGSVVALEADTGVERWRRQVSSEVLAPPLVAGQVVLVRTGDERVFALDAADGGRLWMYEQPVPSLVLRGTAGIARAGELVVTGFDSGKVVALQLRDGQLLWETPVATAEGRTEIERMVDVNSAPRVIGRDVYAASYQGRLAAMALESGRVLWTQEASSGNGLDADATAVFVTGAEGEVHAYDRLSGTNTWRQAALRMRELSGPSVVGDAVAVGDLEGWLHLLSRASGEQVARTRVASSPIHSAPVAFADWLLVQAADGTLVAYRVGADPA